MSEPVQDRDRRLGEALRSLDVPEHAPDFDARLRARLEEARPRARRRPTFPPPRLPRLAFAAAVATAVAAAVFFGIEGGDVRRVGPERASAAAITARMAATLRTLDSAGGIVTVRNREGTADAHTMRWRFLVDSDGDLRLVELPGAGALVYQADRGREITYSRDADVYGVREGLAPGPPDEGPSELILQRDLGALVRALAAAGDVSVRESSLSGRATWVLETRTSLRLVTPEDPTDHITVTVDKKTAFPLRIVEGFRGRFVSEIRVDRLRLNERVPREAFKPELPPGSHADVTDVGFQRAALREAERLVGYPPLSPAWLPDGYERAETAVARETYPTAFGRNPASRDVVSTAYRRGLDRFIVTTRLAGADTSRWSDPLALNESVRRRPERFDFAGYRGELVVAAGDVPHVWGLDERLVVTVSGDLTRGELRRVARSLEAAEPGS
ncbi:MAG: hypothetical protein M3304_02285 [Actinomycetota bacterium]|nr:hypothetical protein [Actinomycetota bacterium]